MTAVLVTGAAGQVGEAVVRKGRARGLAIQAATRGALDITDAEAVRTLLAGHRPPVVINAAAYTAVDRAEQEPDTAFAVNATGPGVLARCCGDLGLTLLHLSTDYVFDGAKPDPYVETDPPAPLGVYGRSKLAGERAVLDEGRDAIVLRTAWVYGVQGGNFVKTMLRLSGERDSLSVVDDQIGSPTFADDLAEVLLALAGKALSGRLPRSETGLFHCAGGGGVSWHGFARAIFDAVGRTTPVRPITSADYPLPAPRPANSRLCCDRLDQVHGLRAPHWRDGLSRMLAALPRPDDGAVRGGMGSPEPP